MKSSFNQAIIVSIIFIVFLYVFCRVPYEPGEANFWIGVAAILTLIMLIRVLREM